MITSMAHGMPYNKFCEGVMNDTTGELIKNFRRHPDYDIVVPGNRDGSEVFEHLELIKTKFPEILPYMDKFVADQGVFGNPKAYEFDIGTFDVPIIIQIYYLALTRRYFGDLDGMKVCEIGPGAGLFFKVLTDIQTDIRYTFVDLPGPLFINRKHVEFLGRQGMVEEYLSCQEVMERNCWSRYDLVISDCAFNELHRDVQEIYIEKILNNSTRGRIAFYPAEISVDGTTNMTCFEVFTKLNRKTKIIKMDLRVPTIYWDDSKEN